MIRPRAIASALATAMLIAVMPAAASAPTTATSYLGGPAHLNAQSGEVIAAPLASQWTRSFSERVSYPVVVGTRAFVLTGEYEAGHGVRVQALDVATGRTLWGPVEVGGYFARGSLAYAAGWLYVLSSNGLLRKLDPSTGAQQWSSLMPYQTYFRSELVVHGDRVYVLGSGYDATLHAVRQSDGGVDWAEDTDSAAALPGVDASGVYVAHDCGVQAFGLDGAVKYRTPASCYGHRDGAMAIHGGKLYGRSAPDVVEYDQASGAVRRVYPGTAPPALVGGRGYFVGSDGVLSAHDLRYGNALWQAAGPFVSAAVHANGQVFAVTSSGRVVALAASSGARRWSAETGTARTRDVEDSTELLQPPVVAGGRLYVAAGTQLHVYASAVTVKAPATTTYGATVGVAVHGPARSPARLYTRPVGSTQWTLRATLQTDSYGRASLAYVAARDQVHRVVIGSTTSSSVITRIRPTLAGPASATRGSTVTLGGTGVPGRTVRLYFRRAGTTSYAHRSTVTVRSTGRWSASYVATSTYSYYATSGCCSTAAVTTRVR